jgi:NADPH2:quinone reductase
MFSGKGYPIMKAMILEEFGEPDVFKMVELPTPELKAGQVLIRVAASGVNPIDWKIRSGLAPSLAPDFPAILHGDVAGTIEAVGQDVQCLKPGDEVFACAGGVKGHGGALAEFMVAPADLVALKPTTLNQTEAAVLPVVSITAWEALVNRAALRPGQRVLIHGGAGGVGHIAIQLAKCAGAIVYTTVSNRIKAELARKAGADITINYWEQDLLEYVHEHTGGEGFDVVFDTVGGENLIHSFQATRLSGTVVSIATRCSADLTLLHHRNLTLHVVFILLPLLTGQGGARHGEILKNIARLVDNNRLHPFLDPEKFTFRNVAEAHRKLQSGQALGKIGLEAVF